MSSRVKRFLLPQSGVNVISLKKGTRKIVAWEFGSRWLPGVLQDPVGPKSDVQVQGLMCK